MLGVVLVQDIWVLVFAAVGFAAGGLAGGVVGYIVGFRKRTSYKPRYTIGG